MNKQELAQQELAQQELAQQELAKQDLVQKFYAELTQILKNKAKDDYKSKTYNAYFVRDFRDWAYETDPNFDLLNTPIEEGGSTAIEMAIWQNDYDIIRILVRHGVDINARAEDRLSAIELAKRHVESNPKSSSLQALKDSQVMKLMIPIIRRNVVAGELTENNMKVINLVIKSIEENDNHSQKSYHDLMDLVYSRSNPLESSTYELMEESSNAEIQKLAKRVNTLLNPAAEEDIAEDVAEKLEQLDNAIKERQTDQIASLHAEISQLPNTTKLNDFVLGSAISHKNKDLVEVLLNSNAISGVPDLWEEIFYKAIIIDKPEILDLCVKAKLKRDREGSDTNASLPADSRLIIKDSQALKDARMLEAYRNLEVQQKSVSQQTSSEISGARPQIPVEAVFSDAADAELNQGNPNLKIADIITNPAYLDGAGTMLHIAAEEGCIESTKYLIDALGGQSLDSQCELKDRKGNTALHLAASSCHPEIVELLLPVSTKHNLNKAGNTALHEVLLSRNYYDKLLSEEEFSIKVMGVVNLLLSHYPQAVSCNNEKGQTPINCLEKNVDISDTVKGQIGEMLSKAKQDVDLQSNGHAR